MCVKQTHMIVYGAVVFIFLSRNCKCHTRIAIRQCDCSSLQPACIGIKPSQYNLWELKAFSGTTHGQTAYNILIR